MSRLFNFETGRYLNGRRVNLERLKPAVRERMITLLEKGFAAYVDHLQRDYGKGVEIEGHADLLTKPLTDEQNKMKEAV